MFQEPQNFNHRSSFVHLTKIGRWLTNIPVVCILIALTLTALFLLSGRWREQVQLKQQLNNVEDNRDEAIKINIPHPNNYYNRGYHEMNYIVRAGDNLADILNSINNNNKQTFAILEEVTKHLDLRKIQVGQEINLRYIPRIVEIEKDGQKIATEETVIDEVRLRLNDTQQLIVSLDQKGKYLSRKTEINLTRYLVKNNFTIENGLYIDGIDAGVPAGLMIEMIKIYGFDIDFQRDIHKGDKYLILYEVFYDNKGKLVKYGNVLYSSLKLLASGTTKEFNMYLFQNDNNQQEYYNEQGQTVRKSLLRTPVNGARISSVYGMRKHPILGYTRMHQGIDFAVPTGTPIFAAGAGTVTVRKYWGGFGNYVRIRHNKDYETEYGHMSRFHPKVVAGTKVRQGQVIGYVGSTGLSTGPHVHLGLLYKGKRINPNRVKSVSEVKLTGKQLAKFVVERNKIDTYLANTPNQNRNKR